MAVNLFTFVDLYRRQLDTAAHLLTKGAEFAVGQGASESDMLSWRLAEDMHPLAYQLTVVINFARQWTARVADLPAPQAIEADLTVEQFQTEIAGARAWLEALTPDQFEGRDDSPITFALGNGMEPTLPAGQWLSVFATTNLYFHLSMIYAILRMKGVPIGKIDLFAAGL